MSEVHNNDIRELLDVIPVIPHNLMRIARCHPRDSAWNTLPDSTT